MLRSRSGGWRCGFVLIRMTGKTLVRGAKIMKPFSDHLRLTALLLAFTGSALAQSQQQPKVLVIKGHSGQAEIIQKDGRAYVDLQSLVEMANATLSFRANRVVMSLPTSNVSPPSPEPPPPPADSSSLSRGFMKASIEEFATMREWASTLGYAIRNGYQVTEAWAANYREQAANNLRLAAAAASTDADRNALQLLTNEFEAVRRWSDRLVQEKKSMDTAKYALSENALRDDPLSQKIITCGRFLASMLGSGTFQDDSSCH